MTRRIAAAILLFSAGMFAVYQYYWSVDLNSTTGYTSWTPNGQGQFSAVNYSANSATGGSLISAIPVPTASIGYEVNAHINLAQSGGVYTVYLSASSNALSGPSPQGSYYAIELQNPVRTPTTCSANLLMYKRVNSVITLMWSSVVSCRGRANPERPILRVIRRTSGGIYVLDEWNNCLIWASDTAVPAGQPGVGAPCHGACSRARRILDHRSGEPERNLCERAGDQPALPAG